MFAGYLQYIALPGSVLSSQSAFQLLFQNAVLLLQLVQLLLLLSQLQDKRNISTCCSGLARKYFQRTRTSLSSSAASSCAGSLSELAEVPKVVLMGTCFSSLSGVVST